MSKIKIGINGFGRIGRITFRAILKRSDIEVVAINDLHEIENLAYLLKYDSVHGKLDNKIEAGESTLVVNGNSIRITSERDPANINWGEADVDVVVDCTGVFTTMEKAQGHINTVGYFVEGDVPIFKLLKNTTGELIELNGSAPNRRTW